MQRLNPEAGESEKREYSKSDGKNTLYTVKPPIGRKMHPIGYFATQEEANTAYEAYKAANNITW